MAENPPEDFGAYLRQAREARGTTLRHIADVTKISVHALEALERNDISRLPGGIFTRAFVRAYAKEAGLDPDRTLQAFVARFPDEAPPSPDSIESDVRESSRWQERAPSGFPLRGLAITLGLLVVFFFAIARFSSWFGPDTAEPPRAPAASSAEDPTSAAGTEGAVPSSGETGALDAPPAASPLMPPSGPVGGAGPSPEPQSVAGAAAEVAGLRMEVTATGDCWIAGTLDQGRTFGRLLAAGERTTLSAEREIAIRVGDAGAFSYTLNGLPGRPLGGPGAVVSERIDASNLEQYLAR